MKKFLIFILTFAMIFSLTACLDSSDNSAIKSNSSYYEGKNYEEVEEEFKDAGFTNIKYEIIYDLIIGFLVSDGEVEYVTIDGSKEFKDISEYSKTEEVVIAYHTYESNNPNNSSNKIEMPNSSTYYEKNYNWTVDSLITHFKELGFTVFEKIPCEPDNDKYKYDIFEVTIEDSWISSGSWEKGDKFDSDDKIKIYYNEYPLLTVLDCEDLETVLKSNDMNYQLFANKYDGRYVEFFGYVFDHVIYNGGSGRFIEVTGTKSDSMAKSVVFHIGESLFGNIDITVKKGDYVLVSGKIDSDLSNYYKKLYIDTITLLEFNEFIDEDNTDGLQYTLINNNTEYEVSGFAGTATEIVIPSEYNGKPVTSIGDCAFEDCKFITSIEIPNSIKVIGNSAFSWCEALTDVEIPNSVTNIGASAFINCESLTKISISNNITNIGIYTFFGCTKLKSVDFGVNSKLKDIGDYAFVYCESLTDITFSAGLNRIGVESFNSCYSLENIIIPESVTSIGNNAFYDCSSLTIKCEAKENSVEWSTYWNSSNCPVIWGYKG